MTIKIEKKTGIRLLIKLLINNFYVKILQVVLRYFC